MLETCALPLCDHRLPNKFGRSLLIRTGSGRLAGTHRIQLNKHHSSALTMAIVATISIQYGYASIMPFGSSGSLHLESFIIYLIHFNQARYSIEYGPQCKSTVWRIHSNLLRSRGRPIAVDRGSIQRIFESQSSRIALDQNRVYTN